MGLKKDTFEYFIDIKKATFLCAKVLHVSDNVLCSVDPSLTVLKSIAGLNRGAFYFQPC